MNRHDAGTSLEHLGRVRSAFGVEVHMGHQYGNTPLMRTPRLRLLACTTINKILSVTLIFPTLKTIRYLSANTMEFSNCMHYADGIPKRVAAALRQWVLHGGFLSRA